MRKLFFGISLITLSSLALEVLLTKAFDIMLTQGMAYMVITAAVFAFGLAGIYGTIKPLPARDELRFMLTKLSIGLAASIIIIVPVMNWLPFDYMQIVKSPITQGFSFIAMYLVLIIPFFLTGLILIATFEAYASNIQEIYFWDLAGAGLGAVVIIPLIPLIGPGGLVVVCSALTLLAAAIFTERSSLAWLCMISATVIITLPFTQMPEYIDFDNHVEKRAVKQDKAAGFLEITRWDSVSKIEVLDRTWSPEKSKPWWRSGDKKHIAYDGGNQSSFYYPFDGDYSKLRAELDIDKSRVREHFWQLGVLTSHYLKRDTNQKVLIVGAAGGQETKAAIMYGSNEVQAVELVAEVVKLGKGQYAKYIGNLFNHPKVKVLAGEGRSYLRQSMDTYDIIQMYSNHTSSSIAQGNGAVGPVYLQTAEAYIEYFSHLADDGILHINHHYYPRMITTAARAWYIMGRTNFQDHVAVFASPAEETLPVVLYSMKPWTQEQIDTLKSFLSPLEREEYYRYSLVENPIDHSQSFLSSEFFDGEQFPQELDDRMPISVTPRTDDSPYFSFVRKNFWPLTLNITPSKQNFVTNAMAQIRNQQERHGIPLDIIHLLVTGVLSLGMVLLFIFAPLKLSKMGKDRGTNLTPLLIYFSCLGAGFIVIELIYIQKFMQLIGSPVATYSTVIFTMLVSAGIGSLLSKKLNINPCGRWYLAFIAILALGVLFITTHAWAFNFGLQFSLLGRTAIASLLIFPIGFFLGMPFPLGVLALEGKPKGSISWAWGMNGVFTVVGGFASVILGVLYGFTITLWIALILYLIAFITYPKVGQV